jgi:hypothetical protein
MTRSGNIKLFHLVCFATLITTQVRATQPLAFKPAAGGDFATILTVSGTIQQIGKQSAMIALFANKPFWGPPHYGASHFALWPADTLFIASVPANIPITIDGKRAAFGGLAVGQNAQVQYNLVLSTQSGSKYGSDGFVLPYMFCGATRIDARSASPSKSKSENHTSRKR